MGLLVFNITVLLHFVKKNTLVAWNPLEAALGMQAFVGFKVQG